MRRDTGKRVRAVWAGERQGRENDWQQERHLFGTEGKEGSPRRLGVNCWREEDVKHTGKVQAHSTEDGRQEEQI